MWKDTVRELWKGLEEDHWFVPTMVTCEYFQAQQEQLQEQSLGKPCKGSKETCTGLFTAAVLTITKWQKEHSCPSKDKCDTFHVVEHCPEGKRSVLELRVPTLLNLKELRSKFQNITYSQRHHYTNNNNKNHYHKMVAFFLWIHGLYIKV